MTFTCKDFVAEDETTVLSGTVYRYYDRFEKKFRGFCNFLLTSKKIIFAGEDMLDIIPLDKITKINIDVIEGYKYLYIHTGTDGRDSGSRIVLAHNTAAFNEIIRAIAKRLV